MSKRLGTSGFITVPPERAPCSEGGLSRSDLFRKLFISHARAHTYGFVHLYYHHLPPLILDALTRDAAVLAGILKIGND